MNKIYRFFSVALVSLTVAFGGLNASAQSSMLGDVLSNVLQGVFSKSNLTLEDICGQWTSKGSAVSFKSDNLLQKAGGIAAAGAIENKLNPYYDKLGLKNAVLTVKDDGSFTLKAKMTLSGTVVSNGDGTFEFKFKALNLVPLGNVTAYVTKSGNNLDVMFDATKLKKIISTVAGISGVTLAKEAAKILDSYDGLCVGFSMNKTGNVESTKSTSTPAESIINSTPSSTTTKDTTKSTSTKTSLGDALFNILKSTGK